MLGWSYLASPDYLAVQLLIRVTILFPLLIVLTGTNFHVYVKISHGAVGYWASGVLFVSC